MLYICVKATFILHTHGIWYVFYAAVVRSIEKYLISFQDTPSFCCYLATIVAQAEQVWGEALAASSNNPLDLSGCRCHLRSLLLVHLSLSSLLFPRNSVLRHSTPFWKENSSLNPSSIYCTFDSTRIIPPPHSQTSIVFIWTRAPKNGTLEDYGRSRQLATLKGTVFDNSSSPCFHGEEEKRWK